MLKRFALAVAALAWAAASVAAPAEKPAPAPPADPSGPLPLSAFFKAPLISDAQISPGGKALAMVRHDDKAVSLVVEDLSSGAPKAIFGGDPKTTSIDWIRWKGENRLLIGVTYVKISGGDFGYAYGKFIVAADPDGKNLTTLLKSSRQVSWHFGTFVQLLDTLRHDPDHVLLTAPRPDGHAAVWRTDVRTGAAEMVDEGDNNTAGWDTDRDGVVVERAETRGSDIVLQGRAPGEKAWTEITRVRRQDLKSLSDFEFLSPASTAGTLYVAVKPETPAQGAARAVRVYDFRTRTLGPPVWPPLDYDVSDIVTDPDSYQLMGVCYWVDVYHCDLKDADLQANFKALDKFFHGDRSLTPLSHSDDNRWWLFLVTGPNEPAAYYLYDWKAKSMGSMGSLYTGLPPEKLGTMERFGYAASDGVQIHAYVTRPPGAPAGPLPLVVMPHGGPEARDEFDYDRWVQALATRGYLVFQPNFRGSDGYGVAFAESGYHKWGGRMENDITDGVKQLIDSGQVDPSRICIFGASYGGYAALIGGAQRPDLYKCVVSWAGISDLGAFMRFKRGGLFVGERSPSYDYWVKAIGDPDADKTRLAQASAVTYAAGYVPPVLLIHGDSDTNVPPDQSREMEGALKAARKNVRLTLIKGEDHTDWDLDNEQKAIGQVIDFISAHIAPAKLAPIKVASDDKPAPPAATASSAGAKP